MRVIKRMSEENIVVIALPNHTSDCLKRLDVSIFGAFKTYAGQSNSEHLVKMCSQVQGNFRLSAQEFWDGIIEVYNKGVTSSNFKSGFG